MSTKSTKSTKLNATVNNANVVNNNYNELFDILVNTICNKNALTLELNKSGYIANMKSKNANDYTTVNNDLYYQLVDGTRIFFGTSKKTVQLWLTDKLYELRNDIIPNSTDTMYSGCNDSIRHYKTLKNIPFTVEWFNDFMTRYNKFFKVKLTDVIIENK